MAISRAVSRPAATARRVEEYTPKPVADRIQRQTEASLVKAAADRQGIERRLHELDEEWEMERTLQTHFALINLLGITLGALVARPWFLLTGVAAGYMVEHALKGWCPSVPVFRRLGFRTAGEIAQERYALKALRGDFQAVNSGQPAKAFAATAI